MEPNESEIAESYLSSLVDLTTNSKPLINMLTMLAEENIEHGQTIVNAVAQHIAKVLIYFYYNKNNNKSQDRKKRRKTKKRKNYNKTETKISSN